MLRRQRSLATLLSGAGSSSTTNLGASSEKEDHDSVPPLPQARSFTQQEKGGTYSPQNEIEGQPHQKGGGLFRRVSNLLKTTRNVSGYENGGADGSPTSARYRAAASTPDILRVAHPPSSSSHPSSDSPSPSPSPVMTPRARTLSTAGGKLVKRPSVRREKPVPPLPLPASTTQGSGRAASYEREDKVAVRDKERERERDMQKAKERDQDKEKEKERDKTTSASTSASPSSWTRRKSRSFKSLTSLKSNKSSGVSSTKSGGVMYTSASSSARASADGGYDGGRYGDGEEEEEEEEYEIRRPSGLGRVASLKEMQMRMRAGSLAGRGAGEVAESENVNLGGEAGGPGPNGSGTGYSLGTAAPPAPATTAESSATEEDEGDGEGIGLAYDDLDSDSSDDDDEVNEIRRPSGLGRSVSLRRGFGDEVIEAEVQQEDDFGDLFTRPRGYKHHPMNTPSAFSEQQDANGTARRRTLSSPASPAEIQKLTSLHSILGLPPPPPPPVPPLFLPSASSSSSALSASPSPVASRSASNVNVGFQKLPATLYPAVLAHLALADAASFARVSRAGCAAARGRLYGVIDLRVGVSWSEGQSRWKENAEDQRGRNEGLRIDTSASAGAGSTSGVIETLRTCPHLVREVRAVVCGCAVEGGGWFWEGLPDEGEMTLFPSLRTLTIFPPLEDPLTPSPIPPLPRTPARTPTPTQVRSAHGPAQSLLHFLAVHPTLERLAVVGCGAFNEEEDVAEDNSSLSPAENASTNGRVSPSQTVPFLPRLTHLHAPPALATRILERIAKAPFCVLAASSDDTTKKDKTGLSADALALLTPDGDDEKRTSRWGRSTMTTTSISASPTAMTPTSASTPTKKTSMHRIPRKPPPSAYHVSDHGHGNANGNTGRSASAGSRGREGKAGEEDEDEDEEVEEAAVVVQKVEVRRVGSVGRAARARSVYVPARRRSSDNSVNGGAGGRKTSEGGGTPSPAASWIKTEPYPHPLRVLRLVVPRPLYEGAGAVGGARVGRAVGGVLARGPGSASSSVSSAKKDGAGRGLALHVLCGPRVERRTLDKVLRTLASGIEEGLDAGVAAANAAAAATQSNSEHSPAKSKAPPSAWAVRGRTPLPETEKETGKNGTRRRAVALLEVRSPVRVAELYKIIPAVLARYPSLRTLLLTRPPDSSSTAPAPSIPPSPRSFSTFVPTPPSTPGGVPKSPSPSLSLRVPPSPSIPPPSPISLRTGSPHSPSIPRSSPSPLSRPPPSPTASLYPPPSPASTLAPPPGLRTTSGPAAWTWEWDGWGDAGDVLAGFDAPPVLLQQKPLPDVAIDAMSRDDESILLDANGGSYYTYSDVGVLSREDAAHVAAWRRRCESLECVRMVSGAWWLRNENGE
ncbi:hypothetical protein R3P38DRAFT_1297247 [Favolaschia claudopus]|uniref:F-box domain-containing protein n=1 Tax=Favolaschia claudopus TaxID=2862362 RepID=A0AAW0AXN0_9AGAR